MSQERSKNATKEDTSEGGIPDTPRLIPPQPNPHPIPTSDAPLASGLRENEDKILQELLDAQGAAVDLGGYYRPDSAKCEAAMRPSQTFNDALSA